VKRSLILITSAALFSLPSSSGSSSPPTSLTSFFSSGVFIVKLPSTCTTARPTDTAKTYRHLPYCVRGIDSDWPRSMPMTMNSWFMIPRDFLIDGGAISDKKSGTETVARPLPKPTNTLQVSKQVGHRGKIV